MADVADVFVMPFRGRGFGGPDWTPPPPASLRETALASVETLRLAWTANRGRLALVAGLSILTATGEFAQLLSGKRALDAVLAGDRSRAQLARLAAVGALGLVGLVGDGMVGRSLYEPVSRAVVREAEGRILDAVTTMELADVEDPEFQDRLQRALMGAQRQSFLIGSLLGLPRSVMSLVVSGIGVGASDMVLVPFALLTAAPEVVLGGRLRDPEMVHRGRGRDMRELAVLRQYLVGTQAAHEVRAFGASGYLRERHDALADESDARHAETMAADSRRRLLLSLANQAAAAPAAGRLILRAARRPKAISETLAGGVASQRLGRGVRRLTSAGMALRRATAMVADYRDFPLPQPPLAGRRPPSPFERISARALTFTYPGSGRRVLDGVDLDIARGEVVALVGENGSGKTTLAKLLCTLYRPTAGTIEWDGVDLAGCDPAAVRSQIAVVFQDFVRYPSLTAAENIGLGRPDRMEDDAAIRRAARAAGIDDVLAGLPKGYDTVLSRPFGGVDLSTGQWQRVALARAFLRDAPLVVLDEPTAALDPRAERDLFETVASLYRSRSALLISHRLSSVRFADRICVLAGGRVSETGTHEELLAAGGVYAELFDLQARAYR
jgi:ATP-binding cassette subfamily B protein